MTVMAAALLLAGCSRSPEAAAVSTNADMVADRLEAEAKNMDALAETTTNQAAAEALQNASSGLDAAADNVRDAADAKVDNMR